MYRRHAGEVLRYARLVLRSGPDAEDVTQATFVRAFRALERGEQVRAPRNWLIAIAHNECRRVLAVRRRRSVEVALDSDVPVLAAESGRAEELRRALGQLARNQRRALVLRELEGRSYAEIAATLALSESAVETLLFRARRAVREQMEAALGCEEAAALVAAAELAPDERKRLRAHTRGCSDCATLERQARGRKGALGRLASSFGLPWGLKALAVALTASAVVVAVPQAAAPRPDPSSLGPSVPVLRVAPLVATPHARSALRRRKVVSHPRVRAVRAAAHIVPAVRRARPLRTHRRPAPAPVPAPGPTSTAPAPVPGPATATPVSAPAAAQPAPAMSLPVPLPAELPAVPEVSLPAVAVPPVPLPVALPQALLPPAPVAMPTVSLP
jgi:RNA polymerase sigma factor (sigma-70 family)